MGDIQERLLAIRESFFLTTSDLAVLLEAHRSTIRTWENGTVPGASKMPLVLHKVKRLEHALKKCRDKFPIPLEVTQYQRKAYLLDVLNAINPPVFKQGTSARRGW